MSLTWIANFIFECVVMIGYDPMVGEIMWLILVLLMIDLIILMVWLSIIAFLPRLILVHLIDLNVDLIILIG